MHTSVGALHLLPSHWHPNMVQLVSPFMLPASPHVSMPSVPVHLLPSHLHPNVAGTELHLVSSPMPVHKKPSSANPGIANIVKATSEAIHDIFDLLNEREPLAVGKSRSAVDSAGRGLLKNEGNWRPKEVGDQFEV